MADVAERTTVEERIALLTGAYRAILDRYREIERLSRKEKRLLSGQNGVAKVNELLRRKRQILRDIRIEEERVGGEREWWKRFRRSLPAASCTDLLSLLDAISRTIEGTVALEAECRSLLARTVRGGTSHPAESRTTARAAVLAYARSRPREDTA